MIFTENDVRKKLTELAEEAYFKANSDRPGALELYDAIGKLPGMAIIERRNPAGDLYYQCAQYVFGTVKGEPWVQSGKNLPREFWESSEAFLSANGYAHVVNPEQGDIIAYKNTQHRFERVMHWGIFLGNSVRSKLDRGHIYEHDPAMIPLDYGNTAEFYRKNQKRSFLFKLIKLDR